jgi:hypothetical protein
VTPRTVLRWHQQLVRRKWTYRCRRAGRPGLDQETVQLITRLAEDNPRWSYLRIRGELLSSVFGFRRPPSEWSFVGTASASLPGGAAPRGASPSGPRPTGSWRSTSSQWRLPGSGPCTCCSRSSSGLVACTSSGSPRTRIRPGCTQQARNLAVGELLRGIRFVIRDRDSKFSGPFDEMVRTEGAQVIKTPVRAPEGERLRGAMGEDRSSGMPGPPPGPRPTRPGANPAGVRDALPREPAPPRPPVGGTGAVDVPGRRRRPRESSRSSRRLDPRVPEGSGMTPDKVLGARFYRRAPR